jgi:hypothetical protein
LNAGALNGSDGFQIAGTSQSGLGLPVVALGDFSGDGVGDFVAGGSIGAGQAAVVFGKANWDATNSVTTLVGTNGFRLTGTAAGDAAGAYLAAPGDVNGDGLTDLLLSAPGADLPGLANAGKAYLIFGSATAFAPTASLSGVETTIAGEVFQGSAANMGVGPVSGLGKFSNIDTRPDFLIATETVVGDAYVVTRAATNDMLFKNGFE